MYNVHENKMKLIVKWVSDCKLESWQKSWISAQHGAISRWWLHRSGRRSSTWPQLHSWHAISSFNAYYPTFFPDKSAYQIAFLSQNKTENAFQCMTARDDLKVIFLDFLSHQIWILLSANEVFYMSFYLNINSHVK